MQNYDSIDSLPIDKNGQISQSENNIVNMLFGKDQSTVQKVLDGTKDVLVIGIFFAILSSPIADSTIQKIFPASSTSPYILILIKSLIFMLLYFLFKNMYLVKK